MLRGAGVGAAGGRPRRSCSNNLLLALGFVRAAAGVLRGAGAPARPGFGRADAELGQARRVGGCGAGLHARPPGL